MELSNQNYKYSKVQKKEHALISEISLRILKLNILMDLRTSSEASISFHSNICYH